MDMKNDNDDDTLEQFVHVLLKIEGFGVGSDRTTVMGVFREWVDAKAAAGKRDQFTVYEIVQRPLG